MRLLTTQGDLQLKSFETSQAPLYAILSHTWGEAEVSYQDLLAVIAGSEQPPDHRGWSKIFGAREKAAAGLYDWIWIDTCCIDKTSSAELSEAINSMFYWYQSAQVCYAYLEDVPMLATGDFSNYSSVLHNARWFRRGWTLQELIAPPEVEFCSVNWESFGTRSTHYDVLAQLTGIDRDVLRDPDHMSALSVAQKMSWAANRETTRPEDIAYCLMGVFGVNMPLLYGEGMKAFIRLQEEILKESEDQTIFAWNYPRLIQNRGQWMLTRMRDTNSSSRSQSDGILAEHPRAFKYGSPFVPTTSDHEPFTVTNRGLRLHSRVITEFKDCDFALLLSCEDHSSYCPQERVPSLLAVPLKRVPGSRDRFYRDKTKTLRHIPPSMAETLDFKTVFVQKSGHFRPPKLLKRTLRIGNYPDHLIKMTDVAYALDQGDFWTKDSDWSVLGAELQHSHGGRHLLPSNATNDVCHPAPRSRSGNKPLSWPIELLDWEEFEDQAKPGTACVLVVRFQIKQKGLRLKTAKPGPEAEGLLVFLILRPHSEDSVGFKYTSRGAFEELTHMKSIKEIIPGLGTIEIPQVGATFSGNLIRRSSPRKLQFVLEILSQKRIRDQKIHKPLPADAMFSIEDEQEDKELSVCHFPSERHGPEMTNFKKAKHSRLLPRLGEDLTLLGSNRTREELEWNLINNAVEEWIYSDHHSVTETFEERYPEYDQKVLGKRRKDKRKMVDSGLAYD
jgi:hypothetical protein